MVVSSAMEKSEVGSQGKYLILSPPDNKGYSSIVHRNQGPQLPLKSELVLSTCSHPQMFPSHTPDVSMAF